MQRIYILQSYDLLFINSTQQIPPWEANSFTAIQ